MWERLVDKKASRSVLWFPTPCPKLFLRLGIEILLQRNAELLAQRLELVKVLLVLALVLNLGLDA